MEHAIVEMNQGTSLMLMIRYETCFCVDVRLC